MQSSHLNTRSGAYETCCYRVQNILPDHKLSSLQNIVDLLFEGQGFEVVRHSDGISALLEVEQSKPDIILIDLMMPGMNGQECVREIRSKGISVPIVAFTALDDPEAHQAARAAGCTKIVIKPCKSKDLIREIKALVNT